MSGGGGRGGGAVGGFPGRDGDWHCPNPEYAFSLHNHLLFSISFYYLLSSNF